MYPVLHKLTNRHAVRKLHPARFATGKNRNMFIRDENIAPSGVYLRLHFVQARTAASGIPRPLQSREFLASGFRATGRVNLTHLFYSVGVLEHEAQEPNLPPATMLP